MNVARPNDEVRLGELCERITVGHVGPMADQYQADGIPFLRSQDIEPFVINTASIKYIGEAFNAKLRKSVLAAKDVVIVRTGYPGTAAVVPPELQGANCADLVILTPGPGLDPWFTAALLNSAWGRSAVAGNLVGVAQQHFNVGAAKALKFRLPDLFIQRRIGEIIKAYCDLIELNTRRITILEEMVRRLFDEWFVRFRFPGHNGEECHATTIGVVPKAWPVKSAAEIIEFDPRTSVPKDGEKPFVPMTAISTNSMVIGDVENRAGNSGSKFQNGDTLLARITPCLENGKTGFVDFLRDGEVAFGSTEFIVMRGRTVPPEWVYLFSRGELFRGNAIKSMSGATGRQRVRQASLENFAVAEPDRKTLESFTTLVRPMFKQVHILARANRLLRAARDLLLPKLISGEIDLSVAARKLEAAQ